MGSDENGFIQVYIAVGGAKSRSSIFWGKDKGELNQSYKAHSYAGFKDNSVEAAVRAIEMAEELGIQKLEINVSENSPDCDYVLNFEKWKKKKWLEKSINGTLQPIAYSDDLEQLDIALQDSSSMLIRFAGVSDENEEMKKSYCIERHVIYNQLYVKK